MRSEQFLARSGSKQGFYMSVSTDCGKYLARKPLKLLFFAVPESQFPIKSQTLPCSDPTSPLLKRPISAALPKLSPQAADS
jgi:hypothetical protein